MGSLIESKERYHDLRVFRGSQQSRFRALSHRTTIMEFYDDQPKLFDLNKKTYAQRHLVGSCFYNVLDDLEE